MKTISQRGVQLYRAGFCLSLLAGYWLSFSAFSKAYETGITREGLKNLVATLNWSPSTYLTASYVGISISLFAAALGFAPRLFLFLAILFSIAIDAPLFTEGVYPMTDMAFFVLCVLWIQSISQKSNRTASLTVVSIQVILGAIYFNAFLNKLFLGNGFWINGRDIQTYMITRGAFTGNAFTMTLANSPSLTILGSIATLIFEGGFIFAIWNRKTRIVFVAMGLLFHLLTYLLFEVNFLYFYLPVYLVFVDWDYILDRTT